jgi:hypothetical protein
MDDDATIRVNPRAPDAAARPLDRALQTDQTNRENDARARDLAYLRAQAEADLAHVDPYQKAER